jgi:DUF1680 family protein
MHLYRSLFGVLLILGTGTITPLDPSVNRTQIRPADLRNVHIQDGFWAPRIRQNREVGLRHALKSLDDYGNLGNFAKAAGLIPGWHRGSHAYDSDVYKAIEGAAYTLQAHPDKELEAFLDKLILNIAAAQQADGYLSTSFILENPDEKWQNVRKDHEMYCAGHLFEAAVAYYEATGKKTLLEVAVKLADHIDSIFGPGKRHDVPGHQEIELALIKLSQATGEKRYFDLAKFFLEERGHAHGTERRPFSSDGLSRFDTSPENRDDRIKRIGIRNGRMQDHKPVLDQTEAVGHAVRAGYMYSAMTDVALFTQDPSYSTAVTQLWSDVVQSKIYITGGVGTAQYFDEGFGDPYRLPNEKAYSETCAQAANIFWNFRMFLLHGEAKYIDVLELSLYNAFLSGVSLSGDRYFYQNTLASKGGRQRQDWFDPACCPTNVVRMFPQIGRFVYALDSAGVYVNLYTAGSAELSLPGGQVHISQETRYPWDGKVRITVDPSKDQNFLMRLRLPGWTRGRPLPSDLYSYEESEKSQVRVQINGDFQSRTDIQKGYLTLNRTWKKEDRIDLEMPMPVQRVIAHPRIEANQGRVAFMRGPLVYCFEEADNPQLFQNTDEAFFPAGLSLTAHFKEDLFNGIVVLQGKASIKTSDPEKSREITVQAVPYYSWSNRQPGSMLVWIHKH